MDYCQIEDPTIRDYCEWQRRCAQAGVTYFQILGGRKRSFLGRLRDRTAESLMIDSGYPNLTSIRCQIELDASRWHPRYLCREPRRFCEATTVLRVLTSGPSHMADSPRCGRSSWCMDEILAMDETFSEEEVTLMGRYQPYNDVEDAHEDQNNKEALLEEALSSIGMRQLLPQISISHSTDISEELRTLHYPSLGHECHMPYFNSSASVFVPVSNAQPAQVPAPS